MGKRIMEERWEEREREKKEKQGREVVVTSSDKGLIERVG